MENEELLWTANVRIVCLFSLQSLIKLNSIIITMKSVFLSCDCLSLFFFFFLCKEENCQCSEACCGDNILQLIPWQCPLSLGVIMGSHPLFFWENTERKESWYLCLFVHTHSDKTVQREMFRWWKALHTSLKLLKTVTE